MNSLTHPLELSGSNLLGSAGRRRVRLIVVLAFLGFFLVGGAWAIATPWNGGPDEQVHIIRAAGVAGGEVLATPEFLGPGRTLPGAVQTVPEGLWRDTVPCFAWQPGRSAACPPALTPRAASGRLVRLGTTVGRYQPLYYALVGWPLRWWPDDTGLLLARLISAALSAGFLAFAVRAILDRARQPFMLAGLLTAATPMLMHLTGVINPNGLQIAAAIAMWAALIPLVLGTGPVDHQLLILAGVAGVVIAWVRPDGPLWVGLAPVVLLGTAGRTRLLRLVRDRYIWLTAALVGVACVGSVIWTVVMRADQLVAVPGHRGIDAVQAVRVVLVERLSFYLTSMIGLLGWVDTQLPIVCYAVWFAAAGFLAISALAAGRRVDRWRLAVVVAAAFAVPVCTDVFGAKTQGMVVQGRYILPAAAGAALLAAYVIGERGMFPGPTVTGWLAATTLPVQFIALSVTMVRYQHGLGGDVPAVNPLTGSWQPPLGSATALVTAVAGLAALALMVRLAGSPAFEWGGRRETR